MADIINPHDRFFRYVFAHTEWTRQLLATALPRGLLRSMDLDTLQVESGSFIDEELREHFSDMLFNAQLVTGQVGYAYMLFEHKSYPDKVVPFQMLRYIVRIWEQVMRDQKKWSAAASCMHGLLSGRQQWNIPLHLGGLVDAPAEWRTYVPEFKYVLIDLSVYDAAQIKEPILMQAALLAMKHIFDPDLEQQLPNVLALFNQLQQGPNGHGVLSNHFAIYNERQSLCKSSISRS
ncbi:MAG: Rpn family recombination-promoting nuclease/putative transposase [Caldilineaceae bacterium]